jgi:hypothetical protein
MDKNKESDLTTAKRGRLIAFWITTGIISLQVASGAYFDLTKFPNFAKIAEHLGYPAYLLTILGVLRVFALITLLIPRFPQLKEWAYAGLFFEFILAVVSHIAVGDNVQAWMWPLIFVIFLLASWYLRPASRKVA